MENLEQSREYENIRGELKSLKETVPPKLENTKNISYEKKKPLYEYADELSKKTKLNDDECKFLAELYKDKGPLTLSIKTITDKQAEILSDVRTLQLDGLTSITDRQAEILSNVNILCLDGVRSITDEQAKSLSKIWSVSLRKLTSITDNQAKYLGNNSSSIDKWATLHLDGITSITDKQAEYLSKFKGILYLGGLTSITDRQAENLSKIRSLDINTRILTPKQREILNK